MKVVCWDCQDSLSYCHDTKSGGAAMSLNGKTAWVTGGGTGIGRAAALKLAAAGARVALSGRRAEPLEAVAGEIAGAGGSALTAPLDVTDDGAIAAAVAKIEAQFGTISILVNNAGFNIRERRYDQMANDDWREVIAVNLNGAYACIAAVLPAMRAQRDGVIVNISSWAGRYDSAVAGPAYGASKHGLSSLTATLNMEECVNGIRVTAICPAEVATEIMDRRPVPPSAEVRARMLQPEDLADTILFVASLPPRACINEVIISPTWNRAYLGRDERAGGGV